MSDVAYLEIRVGSQGVNAASESLRRFTTSSSAAEQASMRLANAERASGDVAREAREKALKNLRDSYEVKRQLVETSSANEESKARRLALLDDQQIQRISAVTAAGQKAVVAAEVAAARKALAEANRAEKEAAAEEARAARVAAAHAKASSLAEARAQKEAAAVEAKAARVAAAETAAAQRAEAAQLRKASVAQAAIARQEQAQLNAVQREVEAVRKSLLSEEEALRESYLRRRRIVEANVPGSRGQMMLASIDHQYGQQKEQLGAIPLGSAKEAESAADGIKRLALQYVGLQAAISGVRKLVEVNREFDRLNAGLITATGSADAANATFSVLQDFAAKTPFSLRDTTSAFVKLVNYGLMPSERAMRSYGNTSSALGKDIGMMIEAVADAQTGEFERLKEFGVKAKQEGDKVTLTFRGVSTTVNKNSKEIQEYLIALGETNFSDAMANRMDTLDGKLSNLGDAWDKLFREVGNSDVGGIIKDFADTGIAAIEGLIAVMNSSAMGKAVTGIKSFFIQLAGDVDKAIGYVTFDKERVRNAEATTRALHREMEVERQSAENTREFTKALRENEKAAKDRLAQFEKGGDTSGLASFNQAMADANAKFAESEEKRREQAAKSKAQRDKTEFAQLVEKLSTEEDRIAASYLKRQDLIERQTKKKPELRAELSAANYREYETEMANTKAAKLRETQAKEVKDLEESLRDKDAVERAAYEKRREMVLKNVDDEVRAEKLMTALADQETKRRLALADQAKQKALSQSRQKEDLLSPLRTEEEQIRLSERRKLEEYQKARDEDLLNEAEYQDLKAKLHRDTEGRIAENDMRNKEAIAGNSAALFGNLAQVAKNMSGAQSGAYKGLFAISKAFSIAQATMSIATGAAKALELGWPAGLAAGLQVAAQGAALLAQITGSNYAGAYDKGGYIPAGRIGLVGELGPELVQGPATVTSRQQTAQIMSGQNQGNSAQAMPITIVNAPDTRGAYEFARSSSGDRVYINGIRRNASTIRQILGVAA